MKREILALAIGSFIALPALANNEIDTGYNSPAQRSAPSAEQVIVDAEQGYVIAAKSSANKSRAEVVAEVVQARRSGNYIVNAELGTTASSL